MVELTDKNIKNFWKKVDKKGEDECWEWITCKKYGVFRIDKKLYLAHRISWILHYGEIPEHNSYHGICVCHKCDNPSCVNPNHLFLGTCKDNIKDCSKKGRLSDNSGEKHWNHKLTEQEILEIRQKYIPYKYTQQQLADEYGVSNQQISDIINNKKWKHI